MTLDQYELCPCGSSKKIKFCCSRDILHELERLQKMIQGGQRLAALEKIDSLMEKHPERPSLLSIKADLQIELNEPGKAQETISTWRRVQPDNPGALATQSILAWMHERNLQKAMGLLQDSYELANRTVTARMYEATMAFATVLLNSRQYLAAKGHLQFALAITDGKDERCAATMMRLNQDRRVPLLLREPLTLEACPPNVTWRIEFESAVSEIAQGRWRKGAKILSDMSKRILDAPAILMNLAIVSGWLADNEQASKAFREYSQIRDVPLDRRVHAAALAQELAPLSDAASETVQVAYAIEQADEVLERCAAHKRLMSLPVEGNLVLAEGTPPPKALYRVLSQEMPQGADLQVADVPEVLGVVLLFGKQTDKSAQLVVEGLKAKSAAVLEVCQEVVGAPLGSPVSEKKLGAASWPMAELFGDWQVPTTMPYDKHQRMLRELQQQSIMQRWPNTPGPMLDGKTPREAAGDSKYTVPILANLLSLSLMCDSLDIAIDAGSLRRDLNLPELPAVVVEDDSLEKIPAHRFSELNVPSLNDEQLLMLYRRSYALMVVKSLRAAAAAVVERPSLADRIDRVEAFDILSDVASTTEDSLRYLAQARKLATKEGESPAAWLIDEAELRLVRGEMEEFVSLVKELQARYLREPGVMQNLVEMMARFGLVTPDGRILLPGVAGGAAAESSSGIWTPGSESSVAAEPQGESKLWVPGMD
jgi:tetratricopeptide (TPR) repeat protein